MPSKKVPTGVCVCVFRRVTSFLVLVFGALGTCYCHAKICKISRRTTGPASRCAGLAFTVLGPRDLPAGTVWRYQNANQVFITLFAKNVEQESELQKFLTYLKST